MNQLQHQLFNDLVEELPLKEARIHEFMFQCRHSLQKPPIIFFFATKISPRKFIFKLFTNLGLEKMTVPKGRIRLEYMWVF